jgi:citrate lyase subunit beta / citryl-CoA lyase
MTNDRPRRSALYLPGSNRRAIEKSSTLDADVVIFDLEDAVAPDEKPIARSLVCEAVSARRHGDRELVIRINGCSTVWHDEDLRHAAAAEPDAILLPKIEDPSQILSVVHALESLGQSSRTSLWCMLETPRGVLASERIAGAHDRLTCLVMGTSDLTSDLRARHVPSRMPLLPSLGLCLLAARAHGKLILDGVTLDLSSDDGFVASCQQSRELGFDGKTLIHPRQIGPCNSVFSPSPEEVAHARAVVSAFEAAQGAGRGVAVVAGKLIEELHVREAERTLTLSALLETRNAGASELAPC